MNREQYTHLGFFNALPSQVHSAAVAGRTMDTRGYDAITFLVNAFSCDSGAANSVADCWKFVLQHGVASGDTAPSAWSNVPNSQIIHSVYGGVDSTGETGLFGYGFASTCLSTAVFAVGYKKNTTHRYVRFYLSVSGSPSTAWIGAIGLQGIPQHWPVNSPI